MSLHHVRLIHGSEPNDSNHRRIGFAIRYLPTDVRQLNGVIDTATLVRGHAGIYDDHLNILYAGAASRPDRPD
jgi:hypothetical protein